jgi:CheY-like chemotaxis protein
MARILAVDDDKFMRELVELHLIARGHSVLCAADASQALQALLDEDFDLVISDIHMPHFDGLELLKAIRGDAKTCDTPVILLTRLADEGVFQQAIKHGADQYLTKPLRVEQLLWEVEKAIRPATRLRRRRAGG